MGRQPALARRRGGRHLQRSRRESRALRGPPAWRTSALRSKCSVRKGPPLRRTERLYQERRGRGPSRQRWRHQSSAVEWRPRSSDGASLDCLCACTPGRSGARRCARAPRGAAGGDAGREPRAGARALGAPGTAGGLQGTPERSPFRTRRRRAGRAGRADFPNSFCLTRPQLPAASTALSERSRPVGLGHPPTKTAWCDGPAPRCE